MGGTHVYLKLKGLEAARAGSRGPGPGGPGGPGGGGDALWLETDSAELLLDLPTPVNNTHSYNHAHFNLVTAR